VLAPGAGLTDRAEEPSASAPCGQEFANRPIARAALVQLDDAPGSARDYLDGSAAAGQGTTMHVPFIDLSATTCELCARVSA
jgi:hypothetical protein